MEKTSKLEDIFTANIADIGEGGLLWKSVKVAETNHGPWGDIGSDQTESATADLDYGVSCLGAKSYKHQSRLKSLLARNDRNAFNVLMGAAKDRNALPKEHYQAKKNI